MALIFRRGVTLPVGVVAVGALAMSAPGRPAPLSALLAVAVIAAIVHAVRGCTPLKRAGHQAP